MNRNGPSFVTTQFHGNVRHFCLSEETRFSVTFRFNGNVHSNRRCANPTENRPETDRVTDKHWVMELHALHSHRHERLGQETFRLYFITCSYRSSLIDVAENDAAKYRPVRIRISWHHGDFDGKIALIRLLRHPFPTKATRG
jgi:hypothetical protein